MPFDVNGIYTRAVAPYAESAVAEVDGATGVNTEMDDVADALTACLKADGSMTMTADLDAGGFTIGNLRASTANGEAVRHQQLASYQPIDATLTAWGALSFSSGKVGYGTGTDTFALADSTSYGRSIWNVADEAALKALLNLEAGVDLLAYSGMLGSFSGLTISAGKVPYGSGADTFAAADSTSYGRSLWNAADAAALRTLAALGTIATMDGATAAHYRANTADKALVTDDVWSAADYVALTDAATVGVDMSAGFNFTLTIGGNRTLGAPTNTKNGQCGTIYITQDGTGGRTLAYHANWKFAGGTDPTLSTAAGAVDALHNKVKSSTFIEASLSKALA